MSSEDQSEPLSETIRETHRDAVAADQHFYIDPTNGLLVMTELHHLERGTCCDTGCRHCPYR